MHGAPRAELRRTGDQQGVIDVLCERPQPEAVLIVDAASSAQHRFELPGPNTDVPWLPDCRLVVDSDKAFALLDPATGSLTHAKTPHDRLATGAHPRPSG